MNAEKLLFKNDLPNDFALWVKIALGCVECSKELQLDARYLERFEKIKSRLDIIDNEYGKSATPDIYAAAVVELDGYIDELRDNADTPDNVNELIKRYRATVGTYRPSSIIDSLKSEINSIKCDISQTEDLLNNLEDELYGTKDDLNDLEERLDKLAEQFNYLQDEMEADDND